MKTLFYFILISILFISDFAHAGQPVEASQYYPLKAGNTWVYDYGDGSTVRCEVLRYSPEYSAYLVKSEMKTIDVVIDTELLIRDAGGRVIRVGGTDIAEGKAMSIFGHEEIIMASPVTPGAAWNYEKGGDRKARVKCKVIQITGCDVKAGHFKDVCMIQRTTLHYDGNKEVRSREIHNEYYASGIGLIKEEVVEDAMDAARGGSQVQGARELMELSEYRFSR